jgi:hypothetical protein
MSNEQGAMSNARGLRGGLRISPRSLRTPRLGAKKSEKLPQTAEQFSNFSHIAFCGRIALKNNEQGAVNNEQCKKIARTFKAAPILLVFHC